MPEITAPAGNAEMLAAAVRCGADAIYLGLQRFSARAFAENFHLENLQQTVGFCHTRGVRVFVALNTLIQNSALDELVETIKAVAKCGVDAIIVQDMAVLTVARKLCPDLPLHASTQCSALTPSAVKLLGDFGFKRVVIGREANLDTIAEASKQGPELEVFVHGALCYSVSGGCYMSAFLGGRSANKGSCASPCRLSYRSNNTKNEASLLSLKDLCTLHRLPELAEVGITAAKIEGRMRTAEYVACAVDSAVKGRDGQPFDMDTLSTAFSHGGFTDGHLDQATQDIFGSRTERDAEKMRELLPSLRALYRIERQSVAVDAILTLSDDSLTLKITCGDDNVSETISVATEPTERDQSTALENAVRKTGGTPFFVNSVKLSLQEGLFVPSKEVATLRRELLERLSDLRGEVEGYALTDYSLPPPTIKPKNGEKKLRLRVSDLSQLQFVNTELFELIIIPAEQAELFPAELREKAAIELSRGCDDETARQLVSAAKALGYRHFMADNPAHLELCDGILHGGFGLNITNRIACEFYQSQDVCDVTLSVETSAVDSAEFPQNVGVIGYGHFPLMLGGACHELIGDELIDRKNRRLPIVRRGSFVEILNAVPLYVGDRQNEFAVDFFTLYMTTESPERVIELIDIFSSGAPFDNEFTRGLYY